MRVESLGFRHRGREELLPLLPRAIIADAFAERRERRDYEPDVNQKAPRNVYADEKR